MDILVQVQTSRGKGHMSTDGHCGHIDLIDLNLISAILRVKTSMTIYTCKQ